MKFLSYQESYSCRLAPQFDSRQCRRLYTRQSRSFLVWLWAHSAYPRRKHKFDKLWSCNQHWKLQPTSKIATNIENSASHSLQNKPLLDMADVLYESRMHIHCSKLTLHLDASHKINSWLSRVGSFASLDCNVCHEMSFYLDRCVRITSWWTWLASCKNLEGKPSATTWLLFQNITRHIPDPRNKIRRHFQLFHKFRTRLMYADYMSLRVTCLPASSMSWSRHGGRWVDTVRNWRQSESISRRQICDSSHGYSCRLTAALLLLPGYCRFLGFILICILLYFTLNKFYYIYLKIY